MRWDPIQRMFRVLEKGGSTPSSTTQTVQNWSPDEQAARNKVMTEAERIYGITSGQVQNAPYPGAAPTGPSADTQAAQAYARNYAAGAGSDMVNTAQNYSKFLMGPAQYAESNPYLQSAITAATRPITQAYTDSGGVMQGIRGGATAAGGVGGSRQGVAEGIAAGRYSDAVGDVSSKMANDNYQRALLAGSQALSQAPQTYNLGEAPALTLSGVGTQGEGYQQAQEQYAAAQRQWQQEAPWAAFGPYASLVTGMQPSSASTFATGSPTQGPSRMQSALGGAAMGAAMGSIIPGVGTLIGGGVGLLAGLIM